MWLDADGFASLVINQVDLRQFTSSGLRPGCGLSASVAKVAPLKRDSAIPLRLTTANHPTLYEPHYRSM
jgi:hypothetical protein